MRHLFFTGALSALLSAPAIAQDSPYFPSDPPPGQGLRSAGVATTIAGVTLVSVGMFGLTAQVIEDLGDAFAAAFGNEPLAEPSYRQSEIAPWQVALALGGAGIYSSAPLFSAASQRQISASTAEGLEKSARPALVISWATAGASYALLGAGRALQSEENAELQSGLWSASAWTLLASITASTYSWRRTEALEEQQTHLSLSPAPSGLALNGSF